MRLKGLVKLCVENVISCEKRQAEDEETLRFQMKFRRVTPATVCDRIRNNLLDRLQLGSATEGTASMSFYI